MCYWVCVACLVGTAGRGRQLPRPTHSLLSFLPSYATKLSRMEFPLFTSSFSLRFGYASHLPQCTLCTRFSFPSAFPSPYSSFLFEVLSPNTFSSGMKSISILEARLSYRQTSNNVYMGCWLRENVSVLITATKFYFFYSIVKF